MGTTSRGHPTMSRSAEKKYFRRTVSGHVRDRSSKRDVVTGASPVLVSLAALAAIFVVIAISLGYAS